MRLVPFIVLCCTIPIILTAGGWEECLTEGKIVLDLRARAEFVDQEGFDQDAKASTARLRLGFTSGTVFHLQAHVDFETVQDVFDDDYNSTDNGRTDYPVVTDPKDTEVNQAWIIFDGWKENQFKIGRQRIKLDNDRFVGNVGWRQNEQTFDAYSWINHTLPKTQLLFSWIHNVNRIFGEHHSAGRGDLDVRTLITHATVTTDLGTAVLYGHWIENRDAPDTSHRNLGLRWSGKCDITEASSLRYALEYADQADFQDGHAAIGADYLHGHVDLAHSNLSFGLGTEIMGGDGTHGFATPLATLHAFDGWADMFLNTPANGIKDSYAAVTYKTQCHDWPTTFKVVYHDFRSDAFSQDYGSEWDAFGQCNLTQNMDIMLKVAAYSADLFAVDTTKLWFVFHCKI